MDESSPRRRTDALLALAVGLVPIAVIGGFLLFSPTFTLVEDDGVSLAQPLLSDGLRQLYSGRLPLWSDYTGCGSPLLARPGGQGLLYPGHHVSHAINSPFGVADKEVQTSHLLHAGLAAALAFVFMRSVGVGRAAASLGAIPYGLNGPMVGMITNWNDYAYWLPWLPVLLLVVERLLAGDRRRLWPALAGLCVGLTALSSGPVGVAKVVIFVGLYFLFRANRRFFLFAVGRLLLAGVLGGIAASGQLVPTMEWIRWSTRIRADGEPLQISLLMMSVPPEFYRAFVYPFVVFTWPQGFNAHLAPDGVGWFPGGGLFAGPFAALALILAAARYARRGGPARALTMMFVVYFFLSLGVYWAGNWELSGWPFFRQYRWSVRWTPEVCSAAALLTGIVFGAAWHDRGRRIVRRAVMAWVALVAVAVSVRPASAGGDDVIWGPVPQLYLTAAVALAYLFSKAPGRLVYPAALLATVASLVGMVPGAQEHRWGRLAPLLNDPLPYGTAPTERVLLLAPRTNQRVDGEGTYSYSIPHRTRQYTVFTYGPFPFKTQGWQVGVNFMGELEHPHLAAEQFLGKHLLEALRVGVVVVPKDDAELNRYCRSRPDLVPDGEYRTKSAYRYTGFHAPAFFVREARKEQELEDWVNLGNEPPSRVAWVDGGYDGPRTFPAGGTVRDYAEDHGRIALKTSNPADGFLALTTTWFPGWQATIDGTPARVWRTNGSFLGVAVPAGEHEVRFEYRPRYVPPLLGLSVVTLLGLAAVVVRGLIQPQPPGEGRHDQPDHPGSGRGADGQ